MRINKIISFIGITTTVVTLIYYVVFDISLGNELGDLYISGFLFLLFILSLLLLFINRKRDAIFLKYFLNALWVTQILISVYIFKIGH